VKKGRKYIYKDSKMEEKIKMNTDEKKKSKTSGRN